MLVKKAVLKTKIENDIVELMVKSKVDNIMMEDGKTTLASKIADIIADINTKAESSHSHAKASGTADGFMSKEDFTKLSGIEAGANKTVVDSALSDTSVNPVQNKAVKAAIDALPTTDDVSTQISAAIDELIAGAPGTYDTLKEIADYLTTHENEYTALVQTVGGKVDKTVYDAFIKTLGTLSTKSEVSEADLDAALREKVNAASEGNHSHLNKDVLDAITSEKVTSWDGKPNIYTQAAQPENLKPNDLWVQILE